MYITVTWNCRGIPSWTDTFALNSDGMITKQNIVYLQNEVLPTDLQLLMMESLVDEFGIAFDDSFTFADLDTCTEDFSDLSGAVMMTRKQMRSRPTRQQPQHLRPAAQTSRPRIAGLPPTAPTARPRRLAMTRVVVTAAAPTDHLKF